MDSGYWLLTTGFCFPAPVSYWILIDHDQPHHRLLRCQQVLRAHADRRGVHRRLVVAAADPGGRDPGPERYAGDRVLALGQEPGPGRGPGDLPDRLGAGGRPQGAGGARLLGLRLLLRLRHLRGRHRHLLGARAHPGVPRGRAAAAAPGRADRARPGRDPARLGLPVRPGRRVRQTQPGRAALVSGLVPQVLFEVGARGGGGGAGRRVRQAVPGQRRPEPAAGLRAVDKQGRRGGARGQLRVLGPSGRVRRDRVQHPRPRLRQVRAGPRADRGDHQRRRHSHPAHGPRRSRPRTGPAARPGGPGRKGRRGLGHRRHAPRAERARRDRPGQGQAQGDRARAAGRGEGRAGLRPLGADPRSYRQFDIHHRRGLVNRLGGRLHFPLAHPERGHPGHHAAGRHPARLHPLPHDRAHGRHHVAQRDRDRDRRDGGRRHRGGGADAQEPGGLGARRPQGRLPGRDRAGGEAGGRPELLRAAGDRGLLPARADARRAGGAALQAARLHQELRHDRRRGARDHARPRPAAALHPHAGVHVQPGVAAPGGQRGAGRPHPAGGVAPGQPGPHGALPAGGLLVAPAAVPRDRGRSRPHGGHRAGLLQARLRVHAPARRRFDPLHADDHARASPSPKRRSCCR